MISEKHRAIAGGLLVFSVTCLIAALILGAWAALAFVVAAALYTLVVQARLFNELESAVVCEIMLILALIMISLVQ